MKFVFFDKEEMETDIIIEVLRQEKINYKTREKVVQYICFDEDLPPIVEKVYDITINTDLSHFDFIKKITDKRISQRKKLERCFKKRSAKK